MVFALPENCNRRKKSYPVVETGNKTRCSRVLIKPELLLVNLSLYQRLEVLRKSAERGNGLIMIIRNENIEPFYLVIILLGDFSIYIEEAFTVIRVLTPDKSKSRKS